LDITKERFLILLQQTPLTENRESRDRFQIMTTHENIAQEIILLDASDTKACKRVAKMLREFARSGSISEKTREIVGVAAKLCGRMTKSPSNEADLTRLNDLINALQKNIEDESRKRAFDH
jgi:DNA polymerase III delta prime subunit